MKNEAIILAAGKGVRMRSDLPKVSHRLMGKPMITRVLEALSKMELSKIVVIVGYKKELVISECQGFEVTFVEQKEQLGTGHAVMQARTSIDQDATVIILNGDVPLIQSSTLEQLISFHKAKGSSATVLTAIIKDPTGYGRIIRSDDGSVIKIVEQKDASDREVAINEVNTGTYCFQAADLFRALEKLTPNNVQKEYYLTDCIGILKSEGKLVQAYTVKDPVQVLGVNTIEDLKVLEEKAKHAS